MQSQVCVCVCLIIVAVILIIIVCTFVSLQFAVLMWILTYVGALFNGLTLLILGKSSFSP